MFSRLGVIFEVEDNAVKLYHWPRCGMDADTCRKFAAWLLKRADDLDEKDPKKWVTGASEEHQRKQQY